MTAAFTEDGPAPLKEQTAGPAGTAALPNSGEMRAIMLAAAALAVFLYFIKIILLPFVIAAIVGYVCTPLLDRLAARTRWPRLLFAVVLYLVLLAAAALVVTFAARRLSVEARGFARDFQGILETLVRQATGDHPVRLFGRTFNAQELAQGAIEHLRELLGNSEVLTAAAGYGLASIMGLFLTVVLMFYFLASGRRLAGGIFWLVPPHRRDLVMRIWKRLDPLLMRYFIGVFAVVVYATIASYIGLGVILGIHHAVLLAMLTGVLEIIPVIGPTSAAVLAGLISLGTATGLSSILAYAAYATLLRLSIDQIVGPIVLGRAAHVNPALIIFCFLAGGILFGVPGVILAVPTALLIRSTLATLYGDEAA